MALWANAVHAEQSVPRVRRRGQRHGAYLGPIEIEALTGLRPITKSGIELVSDPFLRTEKGDIHVYFCGNFLDARVRRRVTSFHAPLSPSDRRTGTKAPWLEA